MKNMVLQKFPISSCFKSIWVNIRAEIKKRKNHENNKNKATKKKQKKYKVKNEEEKRCHYFKN